MYGDLLVELFRISMPNKERNKVLLLLLAGRKMRERQSEKTLKIIRKGEK